ncbi:MAG: hypothetical protein VYC42_07860 [Pseudomonadota bacterium]|nr:hypothetical protein [Pseudomonadota bacterium]
MAMPPGCELTFRYRLKYLSDSVRRAAEQGQLRQPARVLICYLDQASRDRPIEFVPIRFADLVEAPVIGDFVVLRMRMGHAAYSGNPNAFNQDIRARSAEVPRWPEGESGHAEGAFCLEVADFPSSVGESSSASEWQKTVSQLQARTDFTDVGAFYRVVQLNLLSNSAAVGMQDGHYALQPASEYELVIDHYLPTDSIQTYQLEVAFSGNSVEPISGSNMQIDSAYDRHWIRFKTLDPLAAQRAVLTVRKKEPGADATIQFDLPASIAGNLRKMARVGVAIGLLLALPQAITAWLNPAFSNNGLGWWLGLFGFFAISYLLVGLAAAFGFRKPL